MSLPGGHTRNSEKMTIGKMHPIIGLGLVTNLIESFELDNLHDWTEDFFFGNSHVILNISKDSWLNKEPWTFHFLATGNTGGTLGFSRFDQIQNLFMLCSIDLWT